MHFLCILVDILWVLDQVENCRVSLSEMLQVISALLIILNFPNVELTILILLISSHSILLDQSSSSSLIFGQFLVELGDNIVNELLNPRLNPIELLSS